MVLIFHYNTERRGLIFRPLKHLGVHLFEGEKFLEVEDHAFLVKGHTGEYIDGDAVALIECVDRDMRFVDDDEARPTRVLRDPLDDVGPSEDLRPDKCGELGQNTPTHLLVDAVVEDAVYD